LEEAEEVGCEKGGGGAGAGAATHWNRKGLVQVPLLSEAPCPAPLSQTRLYAVILHSSVVRNVGEHEEWVLFGSKYWNRFEGSTGVNEKNQTFKIKGSLENKKRRGSNLRATAE
jgi:hypothetical protein